ncbi:MAG: hypothetical protein PHI72_08975 [Atribacterota bacterium]|nr:hypothetical protein [Atribacterota bacterium]MDD4897032.1 hypothetical protein [Atribacterota bacterium]MDD5636213.1 hypothetical protein [Atribacterota bacterium]
MNKMNIKNNFKLKSIVYLVMALVIIILLFSVFRHINKQNIEYRKIEQESVIRKQEESLEEETREKEELPVLEEESTGTIEPEFRDDTIMIF